MLDSTDIRKINLNRIRTVLWNGGEHTKLSMAKDTGLSVATCNTLLNELSETGEILGHKKQLNGVGRSSVVYSINEDYEGILCVRFDMLSDGKRIVNIDVLSMLGTVRYSSADLYDRLTPDIIGKQMLKAMNLNPHVSLVLIGTNGVVDHGILRMSDIEEMDGCSIVSELQEYVNHLPMYVSYDCHFRAYGAYKDNGYENMTLTLMYCLKNVIPGTASVVDDTLIIGKNGFGGMTGYMPTDIDKRTINSLIANGDTDCIAKTICSVITVLNPDYFVFSGNVITEDAIDTIKAECTKYLPASFLPEFSVAEDEGEHYYLNGMYHLAKSLKTDRQALSII